MEIKHLLSAADFQTGEIEALVIKAREMKVGPTHDMYPLEGKTVALLFEKPSLRTRVSFEIAVKSLGGNCIYLSPQEVGLGKREPVKDVARVLGRYVDCIVARTFSHQSLEELVAYSGVKVINALSDQEHPCQALADMLTIYEKKGKLNGINLTYIGDGNNVANSLLLAASQVGIHSIFAGPSAYSLSGDVFKKAEAFASQSKASICVMTNVKEAVSEADVIYTDVWTSMGQESESKDRRQAFQGYQVTPELLSMARPDVIFMHPLPAHHGEEVAEGLLDNKSSVVYDQAENRMHIQKTLLKEMFSDF